MSFSIFFLVFVFAINVCSAEDGPRVSTPLGDINGHYLTSHQGNLYEAYEGIPYALPPVGNKRFEPPEAIYPWQSVLNATKKGNSCLQHLRSPIDNGEYVIGDEDCLYINVYTPIKKSNESLPVIFWIHGGAYQYGAGSRFGAKYLIDYKVIFVTINYRLGVLGFLSTEDRIVPGNMGLKDQNIALKWVHNNIEYFGGDPNKVTLTGLSAGGSSVHYHYMSPMSVGLFHSGISFSGTAFDCWAQTENSREKAFKMAKLMDCPINSVHEMVQCFKNRSGKDLVKAEMEFMPWRLNPFTPFGPVIEKFSDNPFIDRSPIDIINNGDVQDLPWVTGVASEEGLYPVAEFGLKEKVLKELNDNWEAIAPHLLDFYYTIPKNQHAHVARLIREHYLGNETLSRGNLLSLTHLVGDRLFIADAAKAAKAQARVNQNPVWFYYYNYRARKSISDDLSHTTENLGVCHGDDINLILENTHITPVETETDYAMHKDLIKLWITVARKGVPKFGPKWSKVNSVEESLNYMHISGPGDFKMKTNYNFAQKHFWDSIDFNENKKIIKPYLSRDTWKSSSDTSACHVTFMYIACAVLLTQTYTFCKLHL